MPISRCPSCTAIDIGTGSSGRSRCGSCDMKSRAPGALRCGTDTVLWLWSRPRARGATLKSPRSATINAASLHAWELVMAKRIQRRRTKGWIKPLGAIAVSRGTRWGNPFEIDVDGTREEVVAWHREWLLGKRLAPRPWRYDPAEARAALPGLRGHDLMCWCRLDQLCHADVLLEMANSVDPA